MYTIQLFVQKYDLLIKNLMNNPATTLQLQLSTSSYVVLLIEDWLLDHTNTRFNYILQ